MTEELAHNFGQLVGSLEHETRVLRNISNLRSLLSDHQGADPAVLDQLEDIERAVELLEEHLDDFEDHLAKEEHSLQAMKELCALAQFQNDAIQEINESIPSNIRIDAAEAQTSGWGLLPPLTAAEFDGVASSARGRVTLELVNDSLLAIRSIIDAKSEMLATNPKRMKRQMRQQYEEYTALVSDDHQGQIYFTDEECRDTCIFQSGDATGKAVLTILRQTKRLLMVKVRGKSTFIINTAQA